LFVLIGVTGGSLYFLTENYALHYTQASNVALLVSTAPLLTAIFSHFFSSNEKLNRNIIIGSLIALFGVGLVVFNGQYILELNPLGDVLSLSAALCWAFYTILLKQVGNRYTTLFITRKVFFYGLLTILPLFPFKPLNTQIEILSLPIVWGNLLFLGIGASLFCYFFWNLTVKKLGAVRTTNYVYTIPTVTLIASSVIIHETITIMAIVGALLILAGIFMAEHKMKITRTGIKKQL
jgi:drug/metabolite transporter (DMT)-like permease